MLWFFLQWEKRDIKNKKALEISMIKSYIKERKYSLRGRVKFPTDGDSDVAQKVREPRKRLIRCESGTDSKVWMGEEAEQIVICTDGN